MKSNENKALTTKNSAFMALKDFNLNDALTEELSGLSGSFERIKIPAAGMTVFEIPGENPDSPETVKEFSAVILHHHPLYAYYTDKYTGGSNPPDCGSFDGITGVGNPGGDCAGCRARSANTVSPSQRVYSLFGSSPMRDIISSVCSTTLLLLKPPSSKYSFAANSMYFVQRSRLCGSASCQVRPSDLHSFSSSRKPGLLFPHGNGYLTFLSVSFALLPFLRRWMKCVRSWHLGYRCSSLNW